VLSAPFPLRFLFASQPAVITCVLTIVFRAIATPDPQSALHHLTVALAYK
jgi:hypothetical protein